MLLDAFLKIDQPAITGGSTDSLFAGQIEIISFSQAIERTRPLTPTGSASPGNYARSEHKPITIIKEIDMSSPKLYQAACAGTTYDTAVITLCQPSGTTQQTSDNWKKIPYMQITLTQVNITRAHLVGDPRLHPFGASEHYPLIAGEVTAMGPVEEIDLAYQVIQWNYKGGTGSLNVTGGWSVVGNKPS
ncbi:MAG: type VI secretion system tube protein Hcp [Pirellulaceae bacterium]